MVWQALSRLLPYLRISEHWFDVFLVSMATLVVHVDLRSGFEDLNYASWFLRLPAAISSTSPVTEVGYFGNLDALSEQMLAMEQESLACYLKVRRIVECEVVSTM